MLMKKLVCLCAFAALLGCDSSAQELKTAKAEIEILKAKNKADLDRQDAAKKVAEKKEASDKLAAAARAEKAADDKKKADSKRLIVNQWKVESKKWDAKRDKLTAALPDTSLKVGGGERYFYEFLKFYADAAKFEVDYSKFNADYKGFASTNGFIDDKSESEFKKWEAGSDGWLNGDRKFVADYKNTGSSARKMQAAAEKWKAERVQWQSKFVSHNGDNPKSDEDIKFRVQHDRFQGDFNNFNDKYKRFFNRRNDPYDYHARQWYIKCWDRFSNGALLDENHQVDGKPIIDSSRSPSR